MQIYYKKILRTSFLFEKYCVSLIFNTIVPGDVRHEVPGSENNNYLIINMLCL